MSAQVIDAIRLQDWLKKKEAPLLLDVLPEESYNQEHLRFIDGVFLLRQGQLEDARFQIDMKSLACEDIKDAEINQILIQHLASDDFFDVVKYPIAKFQLSAAEVLPPGTAGSPNYKLTGRLTLKGVTDQVTFPAIVGQPDFETIAAQAHLDFDRTRWDVQYGSGKFFAFLGKHLVNDLVHLHLLIGAKRAGMN
jgi:YceI-like domain